MLALIVPTGDYDKESAILDELGQYDEVDSTMGLTNIEALDGYMLADKLTPRQFAELAVSITRPRRSSTPPTPRSIQNMASLRAISPPTKSRSSTCFSLSASRWIPAS